MSAAEPLRRPAPAALTKPKPTPKSRPRLVLVAPQRSTAGRLPFFIVVGAVLVSGLVAVLLLHMLAAQEGFRAHALQQRLATLTDSEQALASKVEADSAPDALRRRAAALGMVPAAMTNLHRLHDGRAVGVQTPAYVPAPPAPTPAPSASPATSTSKSKPSPSKSASHSSAAPKHSGASARAKHHKAAG